MNELQQPDPNIGPNNGETAPLDVWAADNQTPSDESVGGDEAAGYTDTDVENQEELKSLIELSEQVFNDVARVVQSIGDTHLQRRPEQQDRDEFRLKPLKDLQYALRVHLEEEYFNSEGKTNVENLDQMARAGQTKIVAEYTQSLTTSFSAHQVAGELVSLINLLESEAIKYCSKDGALNSDIPERFVQGIKGIGEAREILDSLAAKLKLMENTDDDVVDEFFSLNMKLMQLLSHYDEDALESMKKDVQELISAVEHSDKLRSTVSDKATQLVQVSSRLNELLVE